MQVFLQRPALEVDAGFRVDYGDLRYGLREGNVNGLAFAQTQIEFIGYFRLLVDAPLDAFQAADAKVLIDVARMVPRTAAICGFVRRAFGRGARGAYCST